MLAASDHARRSEDGLLRWSCTVKAEYDGWADVTVNVRVVEGGAGGGGGGGSAAAAAAVHLEEATLLLPLRKSMAKYALGLGFKGGRRPPRLQVLLPLPPTSPCRSCCPSL